LENFDLMHHRLTAFLLICLCTIPFLSAQELHVISGRVIDQTTREPLPFVNIVINNSNFGGTTDIDGRFLLKSSINILSIRLTYVGYEPLVYTVGSRKRDLVIQMTRRDIDLQEVEILPGINPAHRIIQAVIDHRDINDPEKVKSFSYTAYDKTIFTVDADTALQGNFSALVDTSSSGSGSMGVEFRVDEGEGKPDSAQLDSAMKMIDKLVSEQYLFLMENVTKRKFMAPDRNYNEVIATKMSGFKDPILVFLATQIQSFSFYKPFITIFQKQYVNPIGSGSLGKYFFKIRDTAYAGTDTIFSISFRPRKGTNFDGMKGVLNINSRNWAIQNVSAEPSESGGGFTIRIHQMYEFIDGQQWFPVQLNTDVAFNNMSIGKYKAVGRGRSYIRDIVLNPELVRREFNHLDVEVMPSATDRTEEFWNQYRTDTLSKKDRQTYHVLDSIGQAENFDKMAKTAQTLLTGRIPWGPIDLDINRFANYNTYEGMVLGAGLHTNDRVSRRFKAGGFYQYAFAISTSKYGGDVSYILNRKHDVKVSATYYFDLIESGGTGFPGDYESILSGNFRQLMLKKLDKTEHADFSLSFRALKYLLFNAGVAFDHKKSTTTDLATTEGEMIILDDQFRFGTVSAGFKWAYGEKFIQTIENKISLGTRFPVVWLQYTRGIKGFLDGEFDFNRVDFKLRKTFTIKYLGKLTAQLNAGYIDEALPATNLYYAPSSYRLVTLYAPYSFGTMRSNEFLSNKYTSLFLYHDFGYLLFKGKKWFHPEFALAQHIGFGWLDHPERYRYISIAPRTMELGYYESGVLVNNLVNLGLYNVGIGAFYRWGPYSMDKTGDNFGYKVTVMFKL
jgi:hypothetical protein